VVVLPPPTSRRLRVDPGCVNRPLVTVLVVDDLTASRHAAAQVVEATDGFCVVGEADSGENAIEFLTTATVDLVLMDVHMPGMGGLAAAQEISRRFPTIKVILLSVRREHELSRSPDSVGARFCTKEAFGPTTLEEMWRPVGPGRSPT